MPSLSRVTFWQGKQLTILTDATIVPRLCLARPEALHLADAAIVPRHRLARRPARCPGRHSPDAPSGKVLRANQPI
ncbi:unnamed protein product [Ixodes persulcatus]